MAKTSLIDPKVVARLGRVPLFSRFPMSGSMTGLHKSPHRGASVEFAEYRKYVPGDDIRLLDWRVYARSDRFYLKEFEADTNLRSYFVVDTSASMGFRGASVSKWELATRMVATLAYLTVQQGDAAGLLCVGTEIGSEIPPKRNPAHLRHLFNALELSEPSGKTGLAAGLHLIAEKVPQRAVIVVVSDFFTEVTELVEAVEHLRFRKHDVVLFHLLDRAEIEFDFSHPTRFLDLEQAGALLAEPEMIRQQYLDALGEFLARLKRACSERKVDYHRVMIDEGYEKPLARFLTARSR